MSRLIERKIRCNKEKKNMPSMVLRLVWFLLLVRDIGRIELTEVCKSNQEAGLDIPSSQYIHLHSQCNLHSRQTEGTDFRRHNGWILTGKFRNKLRKMINGNGLGQHVSLIHWNMGSKHWLRKKHEIEAVTQQLAQDVYAISEANLLHSLTDLEKNIPGYQMFLPPRPADQKVARLALLLRDGVIAEVQHQLMDPSLASVWLNIGARGRKPMMIGMMYREHRYIMLDHADDSMTPARQFEGWRLFINSWK